MLENHYQDYNKIEHVPWYDQDSYKFVLKWRRSVILATLPWTLTPLPWSRRPVHACSQRPPAFLVNYVRRRRLSLLLTVPPPSVSLYRWSHVKLSTDLECVSEHTFSCGNSKIFVFEKRLGFFNWGEKFPLTNDWCPTSTVPPPTAHTHPLLKKKACVPTLAKLVLGRAHVLNCRGKHIWR